MGVTAWKIAWGNWTRDAGAKSLAVERAVTAWIREDAVGLDDALSALSEEVFPDEEPVPGAQDPALPDPPDARLALDLANAALLAGEADLAQYIHLYAAVAGGDRRQLPALVSTLRAVLYHLQVDDPLSSSDAGQVGVGPLTAQRPS